MYTRPRSVILQMDKKSAFERLCVIDHEGMQTVERRCRNESHPKSILEFMDYSFAINT